MSRETEYNDTPEEFEEWLKKNGLPPIVCGKPTSRHHNVKILPAFFACVIGKRKLSEARKNDRDYQEGDTITLHEYADADGRFTGRSISAVIGHVSVVGTLPGWVNFSLLNLGLLIVDGAVQSTGGKEDDKSL